MKYEIIFTEQYALIVSGEKPLYGEYYLNEFIIAVRTGRDDSDYFKDYIKKIIAHRPLTDAPVLEGVPLLPEFSEDEDADKLAEEAYSKKGWDEPWYSMKEKSQIAFKKGYNKAKETYKYTEEDLRECCSLIFNALGVGDDITTDEIIQHIQQPKRPKYFECEYKPITPHKYTVDDHLEVELKTITNPQGQTELVGEYIYE
jgi:hypothetical protein